MELLAKKDYYSSLKRAKTINYKRFLKRNLPNVGMDAHGWRHWLTKYTNKESTFHNIATFHTTIPTFEKIK